MPFESMPLFMLGWFLSEPFEDHRGRLKAQGQASQK